MALTGVDELLTNGIIVGERSERKEKNKRDLYTYI